MKFDTVKICSHPRTGSHYIAALISKNFFCSDNYLDIYSGHIPFGMSLNPTKIVKRNPSIGYIYPIRNFAAVLRSIFTQRDRFGLSAKSLVELSNSRYKDIWKTNNRVSVVRNTLTTTTKEHNVSVVFKDVPMTPQEYFIFHRKSWNIGAPNVLLLDYDSLQEDITTLDLVAQFLDVHIADYKNVIQKVGWTNSK